MNLSIAVDGPVGAGKSTVCDAVCEKLNILHLDTGAMYRAVGLAALDSGTDPRNEEDVVRMVESGETRIDVRYADGHQITLLNGVPVDGRIRTPEVSAAASAVSRYAPVRKAMVARQRELASEQPMLLDGRDIGTVVLPDAAVKIYLTASAEMRAKRRQLQYLEEGVDIPFEQILHDVKSRDYQDEHRETDPLRQAEDAVVVDSTFLTFDETVEAILKLIEAISDD